MRRGGYNFVLGFAFCVFLFHVLFSVFFSSPQVVLNLPKNANHFDVFQDQGAWRGELELPF